MLFPVYPSLLGYQQGYCQFSLSFSLKKIMQGAQFDVSLGDPARLQMATLPNT
jgi:hypothetical protein